MVEGRGNFMKDRLWPASMAALTIHGLMIAAMALGITYPQGNSPQHLRAEVTFVSESGQEKGASGLLSSSIVREVDSEQREEAGEEYLSSRKNHQKRNLSAAAHSTPTIRPCLPADSSHKERGKQLEKASDRPIPSVGGYPSGEPNDAIPIFNPPPIYPNEAKRRGIEGIVLVQLSLTQTGVVDKATALLPRADTLLEEAALAAVRTWRFKPGIRTLEVPIEFKLEA